MATATASSQAKVDTRMRYEQPAPANVILPRANSGGIIPDVPLDSLVANLVARTEQGNGGRQRRGLLSTQSGSGAAQAINSTRSVPVGLGRKVPLASSSSVPSTATGSRKDDDYLWETDPNGGWLSSFP